MLVEQRCWVSSRFSLSTRVSLLQNNLFIMTNSRIHLSIPVISSDKQLFLLINCTIHVIYNVFLKLLNARFNTRRYIIKRGCLETVKGVKKHEGLKGRHFEYNLLNSKESPWMKIVARELEPSLRSLSFPADCLGWSLVALPSLLHPLLFEGEAEVEFCPVEGSWEGARHSGNDLKQY